ncbi:hypothetical protein [Cypionkella aquatica]|uniref:hypothetical protein n=1 Tax=Cypionkella aquatica TaxID=1756042 RepID=UPI0024E127AF|nr:hypothetical protein [Cypionkella aquatica]
MKLRILIDAPHRVSSALSLHFTAGSEVSVPAKIGEALLEKKVAERIGAPKAATRRVIDGNR